MAIVQLDVPSRNARLAALITSIGAGATVEIRSGTKPTNVAATVTGTLLAGLTGIVFGTPASGAVSITSNATDTSADAAGTAGYFRIKSSDGTARIQGDVTLTGSGGALQLDNTTIALGQVVTISAFTITDGNA